MQNVNLGPNELRQLNRAYPDRYPFLLQSTAQNGDLGRYDILFCFPQDKLILDGDGSLLGSGSEDGHDFLQALDDWWQTEQLPVEHHEIPFTGGWFIYLAYELAAEVEPRLRLQKDPKLPTAFAVRIPAAVIFDHGTGNSVFVSENDESIRLQRLNEDTSAIGEPSARRESIEFEIHEDDPDLFTDAVIAAKEYIEAGDVYQANLSRQWTIEATSTIDSCAIYDALCKTNPGPFAGIVHWQGTTVISSSPERLLQVKDGKISTRPIAGTRPRSKNESTDTGLSDELFRHPKERAEHIMLIDLERNDLGRVCKPGTVEVNELMVLESYAHVHHIVSNVRGELRDDVGPGESIAAVFPGGTITGCPKVRCMEIISELEPTARGAYTGSFGYLNRDGSMDLNILIRTMVSSGSELSLRAGAGIVADSDPHAELDETRAKAEGMLRAFDHV